MGELVFFDLVSNKDRMHLDQEDFPGKDPIFNNV